MKQKGRKTPEGRCKKVREMDRSSDMLEKEPNKSQTQLHMCDYMLTQIVNSMNDHE